MTTGTMTEEPEAAGAIERIETVVAGEMSVAIVTEDAPVLARGRQRFSPDMLRHALMTLDALPRKKKKVTD